MAQGSWWERGWDPLARGDKSLSLVGLSPFMMDNGGELGTLSWGFGLQPCTAHEDQECCLWVPKRDGAAPDTAFISTALI